MAEELAALEAHLASVEAQVARMRAAMADAKVTDASARAERAAEAEAEARTLREQEREAAAPFQARMRAVRDAATADAELMAEAFSPYLREASGDGALMRTLIVPSYVNAFLAGHWSDEAGQGERAVSVFVQMTPDPAAAPEGTASEPDQRTALAERFEVVFIGNGRMQVRAGHFEVTLLAKRDDLRDADTLPRVLTELVDLEGLAAIEPVGVGNAEQQESKTAEN